MPAAPSDNSVLLNLRGITKTFPGVRALDAVDCTIRRGEVHALMGENGAGKSTLIKVITGVHAPDAGSIEFDGRPVLPRTPLQAQQIGISTVYQEVNLCPNLSVAENIFLGRQPLGLARRIKWRAMNRRAEEALAKLNIHIDVTALLSSYSIAIQQMVAIARALDISAKMLVLDEPTSSLDQDEVNRLFGVIRRLRDDGLAIVFVSHFLNQIYEITDRLTVLRNGRLVGEYLTRELPRHDLIGKMMGKELAEFDHTPGGAAATAARAQPFVVAKDLGRRGSLKRTDLTIAAGEVVGLAGLLGSGRTETADLLFGIHRPSTGQLLIDGKAAAMSAPGQAIRRGFAMVPEDRKAQSIIPDLSIRENIILALQARRGWLRFFSRKKQTELANQYIAALNIATGDAERPIKNLSGGNQQKCILARWLASEPRLLILDEPTRGIDVGAKAEILKLILSLCDKGLAILFISSELEEVVRCADCVVVMRDREKVADLTGGDINEGAVMAAIAGGNGAGGGGAHP